MPFVSIPPKQQAHRYLVSSKCDVFILILLAVLSIVSIISLRYLVIDPEFNSTVAENEELREARAAEALFPSERMVFVSLPRGEPWTAASLERLRSLTKALTRIGGAEEEKWSIYSPFIVTVPERLGDE